jgi:hypothetical protein
MRKGPGSVYDKWNISDISQMIRYSRACGSYQDFLDRGLLLTSYKEATEPRVPFGKVEVITWNILQSPP